MKRGFFYGENMTKLPERNLLDGTKSPETTTGEFRLAMGNLIQYLLELLGDESMDKETARQKLGIDLAQINGSIEEKANKETVESALNEKADSSELDRKVDIVVKALTKEIEKNRVPVGTIVWFAAVEAPAGYLKADGKAVWRETYPDLFEVIGTTYGEADGWRSFNLPNLVGRFAQGSMIPGQYVEAGLPNIKGSVAPGYANGYGVMTEAFYGTGSAIGTGGDAHSGYFANINLDASRSSSIYGLSDTVQPAALNLLPCIKAYHA